MTKPLDPLALVAAKYAVAITPHLEALIDPADPSDPIAAQFRPDRRELDQAPEERADPIGDAAFEVRPGLIHRYDDRVLLKLVHVCAVYCRFCFRREMVGPGAEGFDPAALDRAVAYVADTPRVWEVILSGGDPLVLSPRRVAEVTGRLAAIPHVQVLRWHTRLPVADPARITPELVAALKAPNGKAVYVAVHANHPRELTPEARAALARLADAGVPLVSQTVLLKGVNDDVETLEALMRTFVANRVKPYYLHHGDLAPGAGHFRTSLEEGRALAAALRARASGLCQPTYVLDVPDGAVKAPIAASGARLGPDGWEVEGADGVWRAYPPRPYAPPP